MNHTRRSLLALGVSIIGCTSLLAGDGTVKHAPKPIKNSYIALFENVPLTSIESAAAEVAQKHGAKVKSVHQYSLRGFGFEGTEAVASHVSADPRIKGVWEDAITYPAFTQSPTPSWHLDRIDQFNLPLNNTYYYGYTGAGVTAYVIDSGITHNYSEFQYRIVREYNYATVNGVRDPNDLADLCDHGTAVASILGGTTYGVAKNVSFVSVRIWGDGCAGTALDFLDAMDRVVLDHQQHPGPAVVNWSGGFDSVYEPADTAVKNAIDSGLTVVLSAGNHYIDACTLSPARLGNPSYWGYNPNNQSAITVSGTNPDDSFNAPFLNFGPCIDILAPSRELRAMGPNGERIFGATSGAAPQVAGVAATHLERLASLNPTPGMIQSAVLDNGTAGIVTQLPAGTPNLLLYSGTTARRRACCIY